MKKMLFVASALLVCTPAYAGPAQTAATGSSVRSHGSTPEGSSEAGTNANGERRVCRRVPTTENRVGARRVCMTPAEWKAYNRSAL